MSGAGPVHVFVTGGTGFFGRALLRHWAASPEFSRWRFTVLSRDTGRFMRAHGGLLDGLDARLHQGDVMQPSSLPDDESITHVLHAAADSTVGLSLAALARFDQIVQGTRHVLELTRRVGARRLLLASSGGVYGPQPADMDAIPESWNGMAEPLQPQNAYSVAKRQAEHLCALYHDAYGIETVIARCFAFVGEDLPLDAHFAIGNFLRDALAGAAPVVQGDGTPLRSWLDQRDLADWLTQMLLRGAPLRAYNVGSDEVHSMVDAARLVRRVAGVAEPVSVLGRSPQGQSALRSRYVPDVGRARDELGLAVAHGLEDAVGHALARLRAASR
jgi:dTDP-glucose 4,6-dehydratase